MKVEKGPVDSFGKPVDPSTAERMFFSFSLSDGGTGSLYFRSDIARPVSRWSSAYVSALSLVESFVVMLRQHSYAVKNQSPLLGAFLAFRWFFMA